MTTRWRKIGMYRVVENGKAMLGQPLMEVYERIPDHLLDVGGSG